jgi:hypothetical protein
MSKMTRACLDPWEFIEFCADGKVAPCCARPPFTEPFSGTLTEYRNNAEFRNLREAISTGQLDFRCQACTHRPMIGLQQFRETLHEKYPDEADLLWPPAHIANVQIEITQKCNLRCVYCAVSQPDYQAAEMSPELLNRLIAEIIQYPSIGTISINGHGESTIYPHWDDYCLKLLAHNFRLHLISNFARHLNSSEIAVLSKFHSITVSLDSADQALIKDIRRKISLGTILCNIFKIRGNAIYENREPPIFSFSTGIYDLNIKDLGEFASFSVACNIDQINFWKLFKYPDLPNTINVRPLSYLSEHERSIALEKVTRAEQVLDSSKVKHNLAEIRHELDFVPPFYITLTNTTIQNGVFRGEITIDVKSGHFGSSNLYVLYSENSHFYAVDNTGDTKPLDLSGDQEIPVYAAFAPLKSHQRTIQFLIEHSETARTLYIGLGENFQEVIDKGAYISQNISEEKHPNS